MQWRSCRYLFLWVILVVFCTSVEDAEARQRKKKQQKHRSAVSVAAEPIIFTLEEREDRTFNQGGFYNTPNITFPFYRRFSDRYDFLVVFHRFQGRSTNGYFTQTKNDAVGTGRELFDSTSTFGSSGRLRGVVHMNALSFYREADYDPLYRALTHEMGHSWLVHFRRQTPTGVPLSYGFHFWDGLETADSCNGLMQDNPLIDHRDGTASLLYYSGSERSPCIFKFHPFALYLMGLIQPVEVGGPYRVIVDLSRPLGSTVCTAPPGQICSAVRYQSPIATVNLNDIIEAAGAERQPVRTIAERYFSVAYILVTPPGAPATQAEVAKLRTIAKKLPAYWSAATHGRSFITYR